MKNKEINLIDRTVYYFQCGKLKKSVIHSRYVGEFYNYYVLKNGDNCDISQLFLTKKGAIDNYVKMLNTSLAQNEKEIIYYKELNISILEIIEQIKN